MKKSTWVFIATLAVLVAGGLAYRHFVQELDSRGATRLMRALEENDTQKMEILLDENNVNVRDKSGQTALFYAARHAQQAQIIHKLILVGADPLATDKHGFTPLMVAAAHNPNPVIVKVLAKQGGFSAAQQQNKDKALRVAAQHNGVDVIKMLLMTHASPAAPDETGRQAIDYLAENTQLNEVEKTDLRQVMMLLEILEGREQFAANYGGKRFEKTKFIPMGKSKVVQKPIEKKTEKFATQQSVGEAEQKPITKPIEKEMPSEGNIDPKIASKSN